MCKVKNFIKHKVWLIVFLTACQEDDMQQPVYAPIHVPQYDLVSLKLTGDTLHLPLNDTTYNDVSSMNLFTQNGEEYLSIFDERSESINIYRINSRQLVKQILIRRWLNNEKLFKTSVYCHSFDSIFVSNKKQSLYMLDSNGRIGKVFTFPDKYGRDAVAFENYRPLVVMNNIMYAGIQPSGNLSSSTDIKKWKILYSFDFKKDKMTRHYCPPARYRVSPYSYYFLDYSYCINSRGKIVVSFAADSNLYETEINGLNKAYYAKSRYQGQDIKSDKKHNHKDDLGYKNYMTSNAYGPVYFDQYRKRYVRIFKRALTESEFYSKKRAKKSMIILNDKFDVIGEWDIPENISTSTIVFAKNGGIYSRVSNKDEYALHFIRLEYSDHNQQHDYITMSDSLNVKSHYYE